MNTLGVILALVAAASAAAGGDDLNNLPIFPRAKWTVAVYMNGDNNLEPSITGGVYTSSDKERSNRLRSDLRKNHHYSPQGPRRTPGASTEVPGDFHFELGTFYSVGV